MTVTRAMRLARADLELLDWKVTQDGGDLRYLEGARYGLGTSLFRSEVVPGSGPLPHTHAYDEIFVLEEGQGRFQVGAEFLDAAAGDVVIVPANAPHTFVNTGTGLLRHTAIHEGAERAVSAPATLDQGGPQRPAG